MANAMVEVAGAEAEVAGSRRGLMQMFRAFKLGGGRERRSRPGQGEQCEQAKDCTLFAGHNSEIMSDERTVVAGAEMVVTAGGRGLMQISVSVQAWRRA